MLAVNTDAVDQMWRSFKPSSFCLMYVLFVCIYIYYKLLLTFLPTIVTHLIFLFDKWHKLKLADITKNIFKGNKFIMQSFLCRNFYIQESHMNQSKGTDSSMEKQLYIFIYVQFFCHCEFFKISAQSWALSAFWNFFNNKKWFFHFLSSLFDREWAF